MRGIVNQIRHLVADAGELNAAGYVFLKRHEIDEAIRIFQLNSVLFPKVANTYDSLGEALIASSQFSYALWAYQKAEEIDPENTSYKAKKDELQIMINAPGQTK